VSKTSILVLLSLLLIQYHTNAHWNDSYSFLGWDVMLSVEVLWHFGGPYCFPYQGRRVSQTRCSVLTLCFSGLILVIEDRNTFLQNVGELLPDWTASECSSPHSHHCKKFRSSALTCPYHDLSYQYARWTVHKVTK
jgi:hypothetical protein